MKNTIFNNKKYLFYLSSILIIAAIPITLYLARNQQDSRGRAAAPDQLEAEAGVLGGGAAMLSDSLAAGGKYVLFGQITNLLQNGSFESSTSISPWLWKVRTGANGTATIDSTDKQVGANSAKINVTAASTDWYLQLMQSGFPLTLGTPHTITFWAKTSAVRNVRISIQQQAAPNATYYQQTLGLTTGWQKYTYTFTPTINESDAILAFNLAQTTGQVWLDDVSVSRPGQPQISPSPTTAAPSANPTQAPSPTSVPIGPNSYFVATNGNDSNPGTQASPWQTIQKAANTVPSGAVVHIRAGTYPSFDIRRPNITFASYPGETAIIRSDTDNRIISISGTSGIRISGLTIKGCYSYSPSACTANHKNYGGIMVENNSSDITIDNNVIQDNSSYGIRFYNSTGAKIRNNDIFRNEMGVQIDKASGNALIENNKIHDHDKLVVNTPCGTGVTCYEDFGAEGIGLGHVTGQVTVRGNRIWNNRAPSYDYVEDGGGMDIFGGTGPFLIEDNIFYDQDTAFETGQSGASDPLATGNITFRRNIGWNLRTGIILRSSKDSLIANNTFYGFGPYRLLNGSIAPGQYGIGIFQGGNFGGSIENMRVLNNIIVSKNTGVYLLGTMPASVQLNNNLILREDNGELANGAARISNIRQVFSKEQTGIEANPLFVNIGTNDFHLSAGSPAINKGVVIPGTTDGYKGSAPDLGAFELQ